MSSGKYRFDANANSNGVEIGDITSSREALTKVSYRNGRSSTSKILVVLVLILFVIAAVFIGLYAYEKLNQKTEVKEECGTKGCVTVAAGMLVLSTSIRLF